MKFGFMLHLFRSDKQTVTVSELQAFLQIPLVWRQKWGGDGATLHWRLSFSLLGRYSAPPGTKTFIKISSSSGSERFLEAGVIRGFNVEDGGCNPSVNCKEKPFIGNNFTLNLSKSFFIQIELQAGFKGH